MAAKTIIFCADGTWNGPGQLDGAGEVATTNVFRTYANLDGAAGPGGDPMSPEQEKTLVDAGGEPCQVAKYLHGVGDSRNFLVRMLGGGLGGGLIGRIVRGYTF